jgi:hypothetical protein
MVKIKLNLGVKFMTYELVNHLKSEIKELHNILHETQLALAQANDRLNRRSEPLTDERVYTLYKRSLDWRQLARDIEAEHDIA